MRAFRVAYDGRPYSGFQRQPDVPTVEDTLLDALRALGVFEGSDVPPGYAAAGRTDAGVSALVGEADPPDGVSSAVEAVYPLSDLAQIWFVGIRAAPAGGLFLRVAAPCLHRQGGTHAPESERNISRQRHRG